MRKLHLYLLGAPRIEVDGVRAATDRRKAIALLAYLALSGRAHSREALATFFWPEYEPSSALAYLRRTLWEINQLIGDGWLEAGREQLALRSSPGLWIDVAHLTDAVERATLASSAAARRTLLTQAVDLYRGDLLEGFTLRDSPAFDDWQATQGEHLRRQAGAALAALAEVTAELGEIEQGLAYARHWHSLDPLHGPATALLMRLYTAAGERAAALRQYEQYVETLRAELGARPEPELAALYTEMRNGTAPASPRPVPHPPVRHSLPVAPTPFVGRRRALAEIGRLVRGPAARLVTLIGPGGSGKTRLALEAARRLVDDGPHAPADGAIFVSLAPLAASEALVPALAKALDFSFYAQDDKPPREQLVDFLRGKELLLILDNFEHLVDDESVSVVTALLATAPRLRLLVTSRTRLNVQGEQLYPVPGMSVPERTRSTAPAEIDALADHFSSLQLFVQAAQRIQPRFTLTPDNLGDVIDICRRVDGMPLAIELAAAWLEVLTPAEIGAEVARSLEFLESELRDLPERQRSLRAVFDSSWRLLSAREQEAYVRLAIFRGGFSREAAQAVGDAGLPHLLALVNKSWLQRGIDGRFQVHELLRQFAEQRLQADADRWSATRQRHAMYYVTQARQMEQDLRGLRQKHALEAITVEYENLRAAWLWLVAQSEFDAVVDTLLPCLFFYSRLRGQGAEFATLARTAYVAYTQHTGYDPHSALAAILLTAFAWYGIDLWIHPVPLGEIGEAWTIVETLPDPLVLGIWYDILLALLAMRWGDQRSIELLEAIVPRLRETQAPWRLAHALVILGDLLNGAGRPAEAQCVLDEALGIARGVQDRNGQARILYTLGVVNRNLEHFALAIDQLLTARDLLLDLGDKSTAAFVTWLLAETSLMMADFDQAFRYFAEENAMYSEVGDRLAVTFALNYESFQALRYGDIAHARRARLRYMDLCEELGEPIRIAWGQWEWADILRVEGDYAGALQRYAQARTLFAQTGVRLGEAFYWRGLGDVAFAQAEYAQAAAHFSQALTVAASVNHAWADAYLNSRLGQTLIRLGRSDEATAHFQTAMEIAFQYSFRDLIMLALLGCGELPAVRGDRDRGLAVATYVRDHALTWREFKPLAAALVESLRAETTAPSAEDQARLLALSPMTVVDRYMAGIIDSARFERVASPMQSAHPRAAPVGRGPYDA